MPQLPRHRNGKPLRTAYKPALTCGEPCLIGAPQYRALNYHEDTCRLMLEDTSIYPDPNNALRVEWEFSDGTFIVSQPGQTVYWDIPQRNVSFDLTMTIVGPD